MLCSYLRCSYSSIFNFACCPAVGWRGLEWGRVCVPPRCLHWYIWLCRQLVSLIVYEGWGLWCSHPLYWSMQPVCFSSLEICKYRGGGVLKRECKALLRLFQACSWAGSMWAGKSLKSNGENVEWDFPESTWSEDQELKTQGNRFLFEKEGQKYKKWGIMQM